MDRIQKLRKEYRSLPFGYYHLCTDGWKDGKLFHTEDQFAAGMNGIALLTIKYGIKIYAFELMPNHIHIVLSATGHQCLECFYFLVRRINKQLKKAGLTCLPDDYWFKLVPIEDRESMRHHLVYLARNKYEKGMCTPCGHQWGTGYLLYNQTAQYIVGVKVADMAVREVERLVGSRTPLPSEWEIHPVLGVLPRCFVSLAKVQEMFPSVKDYVTMLVKDYESYVRISDSMGEAMEWSESEAEDIIRTLSHRTFPDKTLNTLSRDERCRLATLADKKYNLPLPVLASKLHLSESVLRQVLYSKEYGLKTARGQDRK